MDDEIAVRMKWNIGASVTDPSRSREWRHAMMMMMTMTMTMVMMH